VAVGRCAWRGSAWPRRAPCYRRSTTASTRATTSTSTRVAAGSKPTRYRRACPAGTRSEHCVARINSSSRTCLVRIIIGLVIIRLYLISDKPQWYSIHSKHTVTQDSTTVYRVNIYRVFIWRHVQHTERSGMDHTVFTCKLHRACLFFVSVHQMAPPLTEIADIRLQLYYSFIDPEGMKGWVCLVGWPITDALPTRVVAHQLQVEHRTGKFAGQRQTLYRWVTQPTNVVQ